MSPVVSPKARRRHDSTSDSDSDDKDKESSSSPAAVQVKEEPGSPVQATRNRADSGNSTQHKDTNRSNSSSSKSPEPIKRSTVTRTSGYGTYKRRENNGGARKESKERSWRYEHDDNRRPSSRSPGRSSVRRSRSRSAEKRRKVDDRADRHSVERRRTPERFRKRGSANDKRTTDKKDDTDNRPAASRSPARSPIRRSGTRSPDRRRRVDDRRSADRRRTPERFRKRGSPNGKRTTGEKDDKDNRPAVSRSPVNDQGDRRPADRRRSPERFRTRGSPVNDKRTIDEKDNKDNRAAASRSPGRSPIRRSGTRSPDRRRRVDNRGNRRSADRKRTPERFRAQARTGGRRNTSNSSREKENRAGRTRYNRSASRDRDRPMEKRPRTSDAPTSTDGPNRGMELSDKAAEEWWKQKRKAKEATEAKADPQSFKSGGAYIPPAKLKLMQEQIKDKNSPEYQRLAWEQLKKRIHGRVNKANVGNLVSVVQELLHENVVRGKGLVARSIIQAQAFSPAFSHVYAALVAIINSKFPHIGELIARRLVIQFKRAFRRNDKNTTINVTKFIAHLVNQQVVHEVLALEMLILLLEKPTDDSVEVSIAFIKECGAKLTEVSPKAIMGIFDRLRDILHEGGVDIRVQYMIEVIMALRKEKFKAHPALVEELDLIEEDDQITHEVQLHAEADPENILNVFRVDADFAKNEETYAAIKSEILGDDEDSDLDDDDEAEEEAPTVTIEDMTETNLVIFRRTVYLTIQSSLSVDETVHKMMKLDIKPGMENELAHMILDCCAQQRTYEKFFGLLGERFCRLNKETQLLYEQMFKDTYDTIHRFDIGKLRNVTRMFAHLLHSDAITWEVLGHIKLNEDDTTSSGRIFLKIMFQELTEFQGLPKMVERIRDPTMQNAFDGIFPRDNPRNSRFSINFFTSIGLGGLTLDLREFLDNAPKKPTPNAELQAALLQGVVSSDDDSSDDDSSSSEEDEKEKLEREKKRKKVEKERKKSAKKAKKGHRSKEKRVKKTSKKSGAHKSRKGDVEKEERKKRRRSRGRS